RRALSVYMWSLIGVCLSRLWFPPDGRSFVGLVGVAIASLALTAVVTVIACLVVGWVEDIAARRRPELWPTAAR
ncbi:MAG: acyltransferase, partial [Actinomycetes bacterium]